ncbi:MAG: nuclease, partial [Pseudomonadota bacterium]
RDLNRCLLATALDDGEYGLISGWRRVAALRVLALEDPSIDTVLAIVRTPADAADAYQAMVEENEIRVGLSFFERARIVVRAVDAGVFNRDRVALVKLFHAASRPKRSKIGSFMRIVRGLEDVLRFPTQMSERTGLALAQAIADLDTLDRVRQSLRDSAVRDATEEAARIMEIIAGPAPKISSETAVISEDRQSFLAPERSRAAPEIRQVRPGLRMRETAKGDIVLSGTDLRDPAFREALMTFLKD